VRRFNKAGDSIERITNGLVGILASILVSVASNDCDDFDIVLQVIFYQSSDGIDRRYGPYNCTSAIHSGPSFLWNNDEISEGLKQNGKRLSLYYFQ
jgi:hypothetical protein